MSLDSGLSCYNHIKNRFGGTHLEGVCSNVGFNILTGKHTTMLGPTEKRTPSHLSVFPLMSRLILRLMVITHPVLVAYNVLLL